MIRFRFNAEKAFVAIRWMLSRRNGIDLHALLKTCYFADKAHLNRQQRPVFGATYRAMRFGPVPLEIYEMAKGEAIWLVEAGRTAYPWRLDGYRLFGESDDDIDLSVFAETELAELEDALRLSTSLDLDARTRATHGPDWQNAELGLMSYEDMLDDVPDKAAILDYLRENARFMRL